MKVASEDSLKKRYFLKLLGNLASAGLGIVSVGIIPRSLGPVAYGNFSFLTNFFSKIVGFFDPGAMLAFYNKISQRLREYKIIVFFAYYLIVIAACLAIFVTGSHCLSIKDILWPNQQSLFIYAAALWALGIWYLQVLNKVTDAYALTVRAGKAQILQKALSAILIFGLFYLKALNLKTLFVYYYITTILLFVFWLMILIRNERTLCNSIATGWQLRSREVKGYCREFYDYCSPLFVMSIAGTILALLDRWLLQKYGGSTQQGFYALSYKIGAVCFMFVGAMTPLIMREFSIAFAKKNIKQMAYTFRRYIPLFYSLAAYFACFVVVQAQKVIYILGGSGYEGAELAVKIMAFYPIHQTYGQLSASVLYATGQTALYRNIGILFAFIGLPITCFLVCPWGGIGMNAGATGLAIKMVSIQFFTVNTQLYFNARLLKLSFWKYLGHQILSIVSFLSIAAFVTFGMDYVLASRANIIARFIIEGILYTVMVIIVVYFLPVVVGLKRQDIQSIIQLLKRKLRVGS